MTLLDRVAWPAVYEHLLDTAGHPALDKAADLAAPLPTGHRAAATFAALVLTADQADLHWTLAGHLHPDTAVSDLYALHAWLADAATLVTRYASTVAAPASPPRQPTRAGELRVGPGLPALPLLALATDLARNSTGLTVEARQLPPGVYGRYDPAVRLVVIDPHQDDPAHTFRHELAHALDPELPRQTAADEEFAETLAALLAVHQPASLTAAAPLIARTLDQVARPEQPATTATLPEPGVASLAAFLTLPLLHPVAAP